MPAWIYVALRVVHSFVQIVIGKVLLRFLVFAAGTFCLFFLAGREALRVLHQKLNFIGNVTRSYDDSFAKKGAKIGDSLKIRLPNQYTVRSGATLSAQDTTESSTTLQVATQKGVDLNFTSADYREVPYTPPASAWPMARSRRLSPSSWTR